MSDSKDQKEETKQPRMTPYKREHKDWRELLFDEDELLEEADERE